MTIRSWLAAVLSGLLVATALVSGLQTIDLERLRVWVWSIVGLAAPSIALLLLLMLVLFGPAAARELKHWAARRLLPMDAFLLSLSVGLLASPYWAAAVWNIPMQDWEPITTVLAWLSGGPELARWVLTGWMRFRAPQMPQPTTPEGDLLERVIGRRGMEPLLDLDAEDALDRRAFVDTLN